MASVIISKAKDDLLLLRCLLRPAVWLDLSCSVSCLWWWSRLRPDLRPNLNTSPITISLLSLCLLLPLLRSSRCSRCSRRLCWCRCRCWPSRLSILLVVIPSPLPAPAVALPALRAGGGIFRLPGSCRSLGLLDSGLQQRAHLITGSQVGDCAPLLVGGCRVGLALEQQLNHLGVTMLRSHHECSHTLARAGVHVQACIKYVPARLCMPFLSGKVQRVHVISCWGGCCAPMSQQ
mmetsp:Transcript_25506/g.64729  ORF Transcript_25506/g.64729 Transcript_25506/m.64729 type:complete len:234 (+) Transcript_25506:88-789(+)